MDTVSTKIFNMHSSICDVIKKLMKNKQCSDRVLLWMRKAVSLNLDKQKFHSLQPLCSDGFILNFIDVLLQLCKPFTANFQKYPGFINKINCFYLANNDYILRATDMEKVDHEAGTLVKSLLANPNTNAETLLSGVTLNPFAEQSSLMSDSSSRVLSPPNFVTDCFFLVHILISFITKKAE